MIIKSNILIEVDGDFWHANPLIYDLKKLHIIQEVNLKNDKLKNELAQKFDIKLIRFWETDIKKENFELILIDKILNT